MATYSDKEIEQLKALIDVYTKNYYKHEVTAFINKSSWKEYLAMFDPRTTLMLHECAYQDAMKAFHCSMEDVALYMNSEYEAVRNVVRWRFLIGR